MIEALFAIVFITIIIMAFLQVCIITINNMTANEVAFVSMRSAAVTESRFRTKEIKEKADNYFLILNPVGFLTRKGIVLTNRQTVERYFNNRDQDNSNETEEIDNEDNNENAPISIWSGEKKARDYSDRVLTKQTVKIYYHLNVAFSYLFANSNKGKVYQSARSRLVPSPDEDFYYKAYPNAQRFSAEATNE
jgi:hypothetical protein